MEFVWGFFVFHQFLSMVLFKNGGFLFDFFFSMNTAVLPYIKKHKLRRKKKIFLKDTPNPSLQREEN